MIDDLIIRTPNGDFDLFGIEDIVQTSGIFNLSDITIRTGEYTNEINFPLTSNNRRIIEYADYMPSINTLPYKKVQAQIIVSGLVIKNGFIAIPEISDTIKGRFYSGNTVFYDLIKSLYLGDLDWSAYDHVWNLANAIAASAATSGYVYPVMDYGGQNLSSDTVDIRKILPATYTKTILQLMVTQLGYTYVEDFDTSDFYKSLLPYSSKNPQVSSAILLLNSVDVGNTNNYNPPVNTFNTDIVPGVVDFFTDVLIIHGTSTTSNLIYIPNEYNIINTPGSSTNFNLLTKKFTSQYSGIYDYDFKCELANYEYMNFVFSQNVLSYNISFSTNLLVFKTSGGVTTLVNSLISAQYDDGFGNHIYVVTTGVYPSIPNVPQTFINDTISGSVSLNVGDTLTCVTRIIFYCTLTGSTTSRYQVTGTFNPTVKDTSYLKINLQPQLVFGGLITYSSMLPKLKCSEFLRDISVRFGLIIKVDDDNKIITATNINTISENIPNHIDWTDLLDETEFPTQIFSLDDYAQNNNFKHAEDKSILSTPVGTDYDMVINNANLESVKTLYQSPFSASENVDFNGTLTTKINLYDVNTNNFDNDIKPRICFKKIVPGLFKFTDGTTTTGFLSTTIIWFIDNSMPDQSMGFGTSLVPKNSKTLIDILQNIRLVKANFNLNIIDIKNLDPLIPVYINQFQSYFIVSQINQFNYNRPRLTELELIKLN